MFITSDVYSADWLNFCVKLNEEFFLLEQESLVNEIEEIISENFQLILEDIKDTAKDAGKAVAKAPVKAAGAAAKGSAKLAYKTTNAAGKSVVGSLRDKWKNFWRMIIQKIKDIWHKFIVNVDALVKKDESFLQKYKNQIFNADVSNFEYEIFPYWNGFSALQATRIPQFNELNNTFMGSLESEDAFRNEWLKNIKKGNNSSGLVDDLKEQFRGGASVTLKGSSLKGNLNGMYQYCLKYKSIMSQIKKDYDSIEKAVTKAEQDAVRASLSTPSQNDQPASGKSESLDFGFLLSEKGSNDLKDVHAKRAEQDQKRQENLQKDVGKLNQNVDTESTSQKDSEEADNSTRESAYGNQVKYRLYVSTCQKILGAKMSILEERYREYMGIFRKLASSNKKVDANTSDKSANGQEQELKDKRLQYDKLDAETKAKVDALEKKRKALLQTRVGRKLLQLKDAVIQKNPKYLNAKKSLDEIDKQLDNFYKGA